MSNAIVKQTGDGSVVADQLWQFRLGALPFAAGLLAGVALARRAAARVTPPHRAPTPTGWPVNFAHRGGVAIVPENTLEGLREAAALGPVVLEVDAQLTADGVVVLMHDETVDRTTDGTGRVGTMTFDRLRELDAGYRFTPDGGASYPWRGRGVRVPTLEQLYGEFPDHMVNIELKGDRPGSEAAVWRVVEAAGAAERTLVVASDSRAIRRFREAAGGRVATAAGIGEFVLFWLLGLLGLERFAPVPFQALQPPDHYRGLRVVTPRLVRKAHRHGLRIDVWTVNEENDMRRLLAWGVDGIMTDRPDLLARLVAEG